MDIKDYFRKNRKSVISGVTAAAIVAGSCFAGASLRPIETYSYEQEAVLAENEEAEGEEEVLTSDTVADELSSKFGVEQKEVNKEETVYAFASANGTVENVVVSEWLKNPEGKSELTDKSSLNDIENIKGDEAFSQNGDEITWQANGNDIYYQGTTDQELPVGVKVTYYLDGKETKPEDMAGVSGNVKIRFDYTNNTAVEKEVNGKKEKVKVPFVAITGLILNENCENIQVENGKTMPQGDSTIVMGYGVPGMSDCLGLEDGSISDEISLPEYFEVSADVTDFSLDMTMTAVLSASEFSLDGDIDLSKVDLLVDKVDESGKALVDGSAKLADGTTLLLSKMGDFTTGAKQLATGADQVATGANQVATGANQLATGAGQLKDGIDTLVSSSDSLATGVTTINQSAASISQGVTALDSGLNTPMTDEQKQAVSDQASASAVQAVNAQFAAGTETYNYIYNTAVTNFKGAITDPTTVNNTSAAVASGLSQDAQLKGALFYGIAYSAYSTSEAAANSIPFETYIADQNVQAAINQQVTATINTLAGNVTAQITNGIANQGADAIGQSVVNACQTSAAQAAGAAAGAAAVAGAEGTKQQIAAQIEAVGESGYSLVTGTQALAAGTQTLNDKIPSLTAGIGQLSNGADQIATGSSQLATGSSQLATGTTQLKDGSSKLAAGSEQIKDGVKQLSDGANELSSGMNQFYNLAIKKIVEAYNGDIKDIAQKLDAVLEASTEYQTFAGINDGDAGSTKFIIKTNGISE
ncbi:MAG: hypothetical protein IJT72_01315 [Lachnospiraceae bacterium]|nr:hypothetical protein [Lachnospiraceae bacterium]